MIRPPDIQQILDEIARSAPNASIDELNRLLSARMNEYNTRPQEDLGGLSPDAMGQLLYGDWDGGVLRLDATLTLEQLDASAFLADARTLLQFVDAEGCVKETAAHNLPRAVVASLLPRLRMPRAPEPGWPAPKNESDVRWLPELRHTLLFARLLARRRGLYVTKRGRELLHPGKAGMLYEQLFRTLFRQINLRMLDRSDRHPGLQSTIAYSFFKLSTSAREWSSPRTLADIAWLESAKDPMTAWEADAGQDLRFYSFQHRVLDPLVQFGLMEARELPAEKPWSRPIEFRRTPLFGRFLQFKLPNDRPPVRHDPFLM